MSWLILKLLGVHTKQKKKKKLLGVAAHIVLLVLFMVTTYS